MHIMPKYVMFYTVLYSIYNQCVVHGLQNGPNRIAKRPVSQCEMGRIAERNGPFRSAVRLWSFGREAWRSVRGVKNMRRLWAYVGKYE